MIYTEIIKSGYTSKQDVDSKIFSSNYIGPLDTLIAAHAKSLELTLVTNNTREFSRVDGLELEDWVG